MAITFDTSAAELNSTSFSLDEIVSFLDVPMVDEQITEAVDNGVRLLDVKGPANWWEILYPQRKELDMAFSDQCVVGTLFGSYWTGVDGLGIPAGSSAVYGFNTRWDAPISDYTRLKRAWVRKLEQLHGERG